MCHASQLLEMGTVQHLHNCQYDAKEGTKRISYVTSTTSGDMVASLRTVRAFIDDEREVWEHKIPALVTGIIKQETL